MASPGGQLCGVCHRPMQLRVEIPDCDHSFCYGCIRSSLRVRPNCPVCGHVVTWVKIGGFNTLEPLNEFLFYAHNTPVPDKLPDPVPRAPYDMTHYWPYTRPIGSDWNVPPLDPHPTAPNQTPLQPFRMDHLNSELIKDVIFEKKLGQGAAASVYLANALYQVKRARFKIPTNLEGPIEQLEEARYKRFQFAVKISPIKWIVIEGAYSQINYQMNEHNLKQSLKEMRFLRLLRHENICNLAEVIGIPDRQTGFPHSLTCLFIELCDGDLGHLLDEEKNRRIKSGKINGSTIYVLSELLSRHWFAQIARALHYLHNHGITQGDMHAGNILYRLGQFQTDSYEDKFLSCLFKLADFNLGVTEKEDIWEDYKTKDITFLVKWLFKFTVPRSFKFASYNTKKMLKDAHGGNDPPEFNQLSSELIDLFTQIDDKNSDLWVGSHINLEKVLYHPWLQINTEPRTHPYIMRPSGQYNETVWDEEKKKFVLSPFRHFTESDWDGEKRRYVRRQPFFGDFDLIDD